MNDSKIMQSWSLIILFYNEEGNIEKVCRQAINFLSPLADDKKEIIFVNDGSTDMSVKQVKKITDGKPYINFINNEKNLGIGASLKAGYKAAKMENVCTVPGDGQFNINELRAFRTVSPKTIISFFRVSFSYSDYSLFRLIITKTNKWINRILFSFYLRDINWVKIYKKDSLKKLPLRSQSSFVESEIVYFLTKTHKIIESPCHFLPRQYGVSKSVRFSVLVIVFKDIIYLFIYRLFSSQNNLKKAKNK